MDDPGRPAVRARLGGELQALSGPSRALWEDPAERRRLIGDLVGGDADRAAAALTMLDDGVEDLLKLAGLPRGPVSALVPTRTRAYAGVKRVDCTLELSLDIMRDLSTIDRGADTTLRTWIHESLHARQVYAAAHSVAARQTGKHRRSALRVESR